MSSLSPMTVSHTFLHLRTHQPFFISKVLQDGKSDMLFVVQKRAILLREKSCLHSRQAAHSRIEAKWEPVKCVAYIFIISGLNVLATQGTSALSLIPGRSDSVANPRESVK